MSRSSQFSRKDTLVTGFEPFGGVPVNPSQWLLERLAASGASTPEGAVHTQLLPVSFVRAPSILRQALRRWRPQRVIALGVAPSRHVVSLEKVALNWVDARIPDNDQAQPFDQPVKPGRPSARFSTWPLSASLQRLRTLGIPCELSLSAGSFVCNALYYALLDALARSPAQALFVHLPPNAAIPDGLPMELQWQALQAVLSTPWELGPQPQQAEGFIE